MEDHLLEIFGGHDTISEQSTTTGTETSVSADTMDWSKDALIELNRIPGFVRGKIKKNTELFAKEQGVTSITVDIMYAAKESARA